LRLQQPQPAQLYQVPSANFRQIAPAVLQPFLDAFPTTTSPDLGDGLADLTVGYSAPSQLDTTSIRADHSFGDRLKIFGRFSDVPSQSESRQPTDLAQVDESVRNIKTVVVGADGVITSKMANGFRFGWTGNDYNSNRYLDGFGAATPFAIGTVPGLSDGSWLTFFLFYGLYPYYLIEPQANTQHQINVVDSLTYNIGRHNFKYGVDYRRLLTSETLPPLWEVGYCFDEASVLANAPAGLFVYTQSIDMNAHSSNFSLYAQDEWQATGRMSVSYGVRWDLNPPPTDAAGNTPYTLIRITDLATAVIAPKNTRSGKRHTATSHHVSESHIKSTTHRGWRPCCARAAASSTTLAPRSALKATTALEPPILEITRVPAPRLLHPLVHAPSRLPRRK
jgi:hypothetical protein